MILGILQETAPVVGWDLHSMVDGPPWYYRLYIFYQLGAWLFFLSVLIRFWGGLGLANGPAARRLEEVAGRLSRGDSSGLGPIVQKFSPRSPEAGLRQWALAQSVEPSRDIRPAELHFRRVAETFRGRARSLLTLMWLTAAVYFWASINGIHQLLDLMWNQKELPRVAIWGWAHETYPVFGMFALFWLLLGLAYRHMTNRLESRAAFWELFRIRLGSADS